MNWYVLQVMTGTERDVCTALRRKGVCARAPAQRMEIRRRGRWQSEDQHLLPGYVFVGAEYTAALFHVVSPVPGVIRWLGLERGEPQALDTREALLDGRPLELTTREFELLHTFLDAPGRVFTREMLLAKLWGYDFYGDERVVDSHIKNLRHKLGRDYIETVRGVGYRAAKETL